jgi:hypothetical protein
MADGYSSRHFLEQVWKPTANICTENKTDNRGKVLINFIYTLQLITEAPQQCMPHKLYLIYINIP